MQTGVDAKERSGGMIMGNGAAVWVWGMNLMGDPPGIPAYETICLVHKASVQRMKRPVQCLNKPIRFTFGFG